MLSIFTKEDTSEYMPILLDPHTTSPGHEEEPSIIRNSPRPVIEVRETEIYLRARRMYTRARRISMRRSAGII
jgi:hypothetical protein